MENEQSKFIIEKELLSLSGEHTISEATRILGLLPEGQELKTIEGPPSWVCGGSETYIYPFSVISSDDISSPFILKAVTVFSIARSIDDIVNEWVSRRRILESAGIHVPRLLLAKEGIILEEFIPYELKTFLKGRSDIDNLVAQVFRYAGTLVRLGFQPIGAFHDLHTDGKNVIPVDFGEDLGPAGVNNHKTMKLYDDAIDWLRNCNLRIEAQRAKVLQNIYLESLR